MVVIIVSLISILVNLIILAINIKLYTEFYKERISAIRRYMLKNKQNRLAAK